MDIDSRSLLCLWAQFTCSEASQSAELGRTPLVEEFGAREAFMTLVANTYVNYLLNEDMRRREFDVLGNVVAGVPVRRVRAAGDPTRLFRSLRSYRCGRQPNWKPENYDPYDEGRLIVQPIRLRGYDCGSSPHRSLRRRPFAGQSVRGPWSWMDISTGPGIMAVLACQLGAGRVYAIEPGEVIQVAREVAAENQCGEKIVFFEDLSTQVTIPVLADVIVSDLRGALPLLEGHIPSIIDARQRFLSPGGTLIGRKDRIWTAVVDSPKVQAKIVDAWDRNSLGQDLGAARRRVLNEFRRAEVTPGQLLTAPKLWATLDYTTIESPDVRGTLQWKAERDGTGHGMLVWFEMELADGVAFSSGPASPDSIYGSAFLPWLEPVPLAEGQNVCADLEARLLEKDYFWRWTTQVE